MDLEPGTWNPELGTLRESYARHQGHSKKNLPANGRGRAFFCDRNGQNLGRYLKEENAVPLVYRVRNRVFNRADFDVYGSVSGHERYRNLGKQSAGRLGVRHYQLRLVDRYRARRNADFGDSAAA